MPLRNVTTACGSALLFPRPRAEAGPGARSRTAERAALCQGRLAAACSRSAGSRLLVVTSEALSVSWVFFIKRSDERSKETASAERCFTVRDLRDGKRSMDGAFGASRAGTTTPVRTLGRANGAKPQRGWCLSRGVRTLSPPQPLRRVCGRAALPARKQRPLWWGFSAPRQGA